MMLLFNRNGMFDVNAAKSLLEKLDRLAGDIRDLMKGVPPSSEILEAAPTMLNWRVAEEPVSILLGEVVGHPNLPGHRLVATSPIVVIGSELGWVRTSSRYYKLAAPYPSQSNIT